MRAGALDLAGAVRQQMALALGPTPIACLSNSLYFLCILDLPHRREQEEKPSELGTQCEMEMLWDCLLPGKNSPIFFPLSLPTFRIPRKRSITLLCYVILS